MQTTVTGSGTPLDSATATFGVRWPVFSPTQGVILNGKPLKLRGVDLHNDEGALGSVDNYDALWRQMSALKAGGVNAFRTSHNPPSPEMIDVCQRLGIVMMVEAFDAWDVEASCRPTITSSSTSGVTTTSRKWSTRPRTRPR